MPIYVDETFTMTPRTAYAQRYGNQWSHLTCDGDLEELHTFAERIGIARKWFQSGSTPHYDLIPKKRAEAVRFGAIETTAVERAEWRRRKAIQKIVEEIVDLDLESVRCTSVDDFGGAGCCQREAQALEEKLERMGYSLNEHEDERTLHVLFKGEPWMVFSLDESAWQLPDGTWPWEKKEEGDTIDE